MVAARACCSTNIASKVEFCKQLQHTYPEFSQRPKSTFIVSPSHVKVLYSIRVSPLNHLNRNGANLLCNELLAKSRFNYTVHPSLLDWLLVCRGVIIIDIKQRTKTKKTYKKRTISRLLPIKHFLTLHIFSTHGPKEIVRRVHDAQKTFVLPGLKFKPHERRGSYSCIIDATTV